MRDWAFALISALILVGVLLLSVRIFMELLWKT